MTEETEYGLIMKFHDASESFCNGFECGMLWQDMAQLKNIETTVHSENLEQIKSMVVHFGYAIEFKPTDIEGWTFIKAYYVGKKQKFKIIEGGINHDRD